jgi:D-serine deaminase-like pyridoxal phosphate-dependent protein
MKIFDKEFLSDTPFVAVDLTILEQNIQRLSNLAKEANVKLRPHTKTHKSPFIANKQIEAGASGITTAKLGEAEIMVNHGITDILIAFPILGKKKLNRFSQLLEKAQLTVALDELSVAKGINDVGEHHKTKIPIYVDVDTGLGRMGKSPNESIQTIRKISELPFIEIKGLMSHSGHAYAKSTEEEVKRIAIEDATILHDVKVEMEKYGIVIQEISIGASATIRFIKEIPFITEVRPGMYVFNDRFVMGAGGATVENCAATVFSTIISKPSHNRFIIDAGSKTLSHDPFKNGGYGYIKGHDNLTIARLSEEHGIVEIKGNCPLEVGDAIEIIPNHICPVINLADYIYGFRDGHLEKEINIEARGKNR